MNITRHRSAATLEGLANTARAACPASRLPKAAVTPRTILLA